MDACKPHLILLGDESVGAHIVLPDVGGNQNLCY
jgi:hypothetical protein